MTLFKAAGNKSPDDYEMTLHIHTAEYGWEMIDPIEFSEIGQDCDTLFSDFYVEFFSEIRLTC